MFTQSIDRKQKKITITFLFLVVFFLAFLGYDLVQRMQIYRVLEQDVLQSHAKDAVLPLEDVARRQQDFFIVDVREEEEFAQGHLISAQHMRLGDFLTNQGNQQNVIADAGKKQILFFCHDGVRSTLAQEVLRDTFGVTSFIVKDGFSQMRSNKSLADSVWEGSLAYVLPYDFWKDLRNRDYKLSDIKDDFVVDTSDVQHVEESQKRTVIHAPIMRMSSSAVAAVIESIGMQTFTVVCDSKVSCFYAKILAHRVEQRGGRFTGYYLWKEDH